MALILPSERVKMMPSGRYLAELWQQRIERQLVRSDVRQSMAQWWWPGCLSIACVADPAFVDQRFLGNHRKYWHADCPNRQPHHWPVEINPTTSDPELTEAIKAASRTGLLAVLRLDRAGIASGPFQLSG